jgi:hypothetical protein
MKVNLSKKIVCGVLAGMMAMSLCACSGDGTTTAGNTTATVEGSDTVVAVLNGQNVTRSEVGSDLVAAEKDAISAYIYTKLQSEFFSDVEVSESDLNLQLATIKGQVGEEQWPLYLAMYGGGSEEAFTEMLRESLKSEQYISKKMETVSVTSDELNEAYNANPDHYNIAVLDVIFFGDVAQMNQAKEHYNAGKTFDEVAEAMNLQISSNEHAYFYSDSLTWEKDFNDCVVGDVIFSGEDSGSLVFARIKELNMGLDNPTVKNDLTESIKYEKAYEIANKEYGEFLKEQKLTIFGEDFPLYDDTTEEITSPVTEEVTD